MRSLEQARCVADPRMGCNTARVRRASDVREHGARNARDKACVKQRSGVGVGVAKGQGRGRANKRKAAMMAARPRAGRPFRGGICPSCTPSTDTRASTPCGFVRRLPSAHCDALQRKRVGHNRSPLQSVHTQTGYCARPRARRLERGRLGNCPYMEALRSSLCNLLSLLPCCLKTCGGTCAGLNTKPHIHAPHTTHETRVGTKEGACGGKQNPVPVQGQRNTSLPPAASWLAAAPRC